MQFIHFIAGNILRIGGKYNFHRENFHRLLAFATPNFAKKTFANSHKTAKFAKVFCLKSFSIQ